jgi:tRNA (guanosine-2'-O-)-methyltransferase
MTRYPQETRRYLLDDLQDMITEDRWNKFHDVINNRTNYLAVVLEDIFQPHNASAVIRTCELTGVQNLHIIENANTYEINPDIVVGSNKWINIYRYNNENYNTLNCFKKLRKKGYRIVATSPHENDCLLEDLPLNQKTALVFGNEGAGLSEEAMKNADAFVKIPIYGFTESYNISVSVALCLYHLVGRLKTSSVSWQLSADEKEQLLFEYAIKTVRQPQKVLKTLLQKINKNKF